MVMTCSIEWSAKSWLKGPIEKAAEGGQTGYAKDLTAALRAALGKASTAKNGGKGKGKGRKKRDTTATDTLADAQSATLSNAKTARQANWGILEPLRGTLEAVVDIFSPLVSTTTIITVLCAVIVFQVWWSGRGQPHRRAAGGLGLPMHQRLATYEELWRSEETELWRWLGERVGMESMSLVPDADDRHARKHRQMVIKQESALDKLDELGEREMTEAIRVTRERLQVLEDAVKERRKKREGVVSEGSG